MINERKSIGVILLAAGGSSRLGRPKQLLPLEGQTLLQLSLQAAVSANTGPVIVVLGAHAEEVKENLIDLGVDLVQNPEWKEGMAASIRCGLKHLLQLYPTITGVILMVCDQPYVSADLLHKIVAAYQGTGKPIITCSYANTFGPPTLFDKHLFQELLQLRGDVGARSILIQHANEVEAIVFPEGNVDIDTETDYKQIATGDPAL